MARRRAQWLLLAVALLLILTGVLVTELLRIKRDLEHGAAALTDIDLLRVDERGGLLAIVDGAADRVERADQRAHSSLALRGLATVPLLGSQVDALRDLTSVSADIAGEARRAAAEIQETLDTTTGADGRLALAHTAARALDDVATAVEQVEIDTDRWLLAPLADARHELRARLARATFDLRDATELVAAAEGFLTGPRRYLVLGGNNAEMRGTAIPTTSGVAQIEQGAIEVGEFSGATCCDANGIELRRPVPVPDEYVQVYGWLNGGQGYRTTTASPNWPVTAPIMADITERNRWGAVDGVILVDTFVLAVLLEVVGPVTVDGIEYSRATAGEQLLYRNYLRYPTHADNAELDAHQSRVAAAVFAALNTRDYSLFDLAGRLSQLARGRHLFGWSADEAENRLWVSLGADGALRHDGLLVTVNQLNASKLDYFSDLSIEVRTVDAGDHQRATMRITLTNPEHGETSEYIDGGGRYAQPGNWGAWVLAYLPPEAYDITGDPTLTTGGRDGPMTVVGMILEVPEGEARVVEIAFSLPHDIAEVVVLPASRLRPVGWQFNDGPPLPDFVPFRVDLDTGELLGQENDPPVTVP
ncbi:MAG: DUF4012 domain-containing protein [Acidimicrobiales bacterium]